MNYLLRYYQFRLHSVNNLYKSKSRIRYNYQQMDLRKTLIKYSFLILILYFFIASPASAEDTLEEDLLRKISELQSVLAGLIESQSLSPQPSIFSRNLRLGDKGLDVLELQKVLNSDPETKIVSFGPGSPGQETDFFGNLTRTAVLKFQQKYASEVLHPLGIFTPTGFVGERTRVKLSSLSSKIPSEIPKGSFTEEESGATPPIMPKISVPEQIDEDLIINAPSFYETSPGQNIFLTGIGFSESIELIIGGRLIASTFISEEALSFTVPDLEPGKYNVSLIKDGKKSLNDSFLVIVTPGAERPVISGVSVSSDRLVISGSGFAPEENEVITNFGFKRGLSSSDDTITVNISDLLGGVEGLETNIFLIMNVSVVNKNGISNNFQNVLVKI